jgi:hypothetical protein
VGFYVFGEANVWRFLSSQKASGKSEERENKHFRCNTLSIIKLTRTFLKNLLPTYSGQKTMKFSGFPETLETLYYITLLEIKKKILRNQFCSLIFFSGHAVA